jgi:hypothetical protein
MNENIRHKIGDRVVALTNPMDDDCQPRIKGHVYVVEAICYCAKCGKQAINIGQHIDESRYNDETECDCGYSTKENDWLFYTDSELFAKVDDIEETLTEAINNEDYELASMLRDLKK